MKLLEDRIKRDGRILDGNILKVDSFLNHQTDPELMMEMGKNFAQHFRQKNITKVLTLEVSGIAPAVMTAYVLNVPMVFAKKISSYTLSHDTYTGRVISYTKAKEYDIKVDRKFLSRDDNVLIIDDFLAKGQALKGLMDIVSQSGAKVAGVGIVIEKQFQEGGKKYREMGYDIYSLASIKEFKDGKVIF